MRTLRFLVAGILVCLCSFATAADRPTVGVVEFKNETNAYWFSGGVGWDLANMLTNELVGTGVFRVVERSMLESVLAEQNLA
ncbi:MAG: penicillin-binding protein activator LpoB, partial [Gammaproteobacteria bacterium]